MMILIDVLIDLRMNFENALNFTLFHRTGLTPTEIG